MSSVAGDAAPATTARGGSGLEIRSLTKEFAAFTAVKSLDLDVPHGSFFALLGPSGCGKTTTLRMVGGLEAHTSDRREIPAFPAVKSLDLDVPHGSFFALLGPSGCGKTTTLRMVAGLETPTSGTIRLAGRDITFEKPYRRPVNTVFQNYALFPHLDIFENVAFGPRRRKASGVDAEVHRMLDLVELPSQARKRPMQLSGGQQQRVA